MEIVKSDRVIRDGKVAVLVSSGFGAGWSSWNIGTKILFDPRIVEAVALKVPFSAVEDYLNYEYPNAYFGGYDQLYIEWIPLGTQFRIDEYDGAESVITSDDFQWITA